MAPPALRRNDLPGTRVAHDLLRNGSFLVWRKIEQHPDRFAGLAATLAETRWIGPDEAAELIIGRRRNGATLTSSELYDFDYSDDPPDGDPDALPVVPLQSHVRRANPRATPGFGDPRPRIPVSDQLLKPDYTHGAFHRILRRSMLWEDGNRVGTIFRCYQTSISDQFEFIQRNWLNDGGPFRQGRAIDPVAGTARAEPIPGTNLDTQTAEFDDITDPRAGERLQLMDPDRGGNRAACPFTPLTTPLATIYVFVPGRLAMLDLTDGKFGEQ
jgi:deferrochelatase/peroxidase EfeB